MKTTRNPSGRRRDSSAGGLSGWQWLISRLLIDRERRRREMRRQSAEAAQLRKSRRRRSRRLAHLTRELRKPLARIRKPVRSLLNGEEPADPKKEYRLLLQHTEQMQGLLDQLLELSRPESGGPELEPADIVIPPPEQAFLGELIGAIEARMDDTSLTIKSLSKDLSMSRSQLHRRLKALTGEAPGSFVRRFRLQRAAQLLRKSRLNISEVGFQVGFRTHAHFTKRFRDHFGCTPSDYQARRLNKQ